MTEIYLAEISAYNPTLPGLVTLRYSSGLGYNHPSAPGYYEPRVEQPATLERTAFSSGTTLGAVETGYGALVLQNLDGALDFLIDYGLDGRRIAILIGDSEAAYSSFTTLFVGTMEQPTFTISSIDILLRDRLFEFDKPAQPAKYGGTNVLPAGVDGTEELKGNSIPMVFGIAKGVDPPLVNSARLIYQIGHSTVQAVSVTYAGLALTQGANYTDLADMQANQPAAAQFRMLSTANGSYIRLGFQPNGAIRATITQGAAAANRTAAQILSALATGPGGLSPGDVFSADVTALDAGNSGQVGIWVEGETTVREAMTQVAQSVGAWFGFDRLGRLRMQRLVVPSGTPVGTFKVLDKNAVADALTADIVSIEKLASNDPGAGLPTWQVSLKYAYRYSPQSPESVVAALPEATKADIAKQWRTVVKEDPAVLTVHPKAAKLEFETLFSSSVDAEAEAQRRLDLYKVRRDRYRLRAVLEDSFVSTIDLGSVVSVELSRFGLSSGKLFLVIGISTDAARQFVDLDLWG